MDNDYRLMNMIDEKARLAGSNKMELLLFSLGSTEVFGINVFKVREVCETLPITRTPNMPAGVEGIISLRGSILPVIDLACCLRMDNDQPKTKLIITEFSSHTQAFLVEDVDRIVRVDWEQVKSPQSIGQSQSAMITALTELAEGKLVSILDVEQILAEVIGESDVPEMENLRSDHPHPVFFADDSNMARKKITEVLDRLHLPHQSATNGREAWEKLKTIASRAEQEHRDIKEIVSLILVDAEMPEMDGYVLTRHIKEDPRFKGIPVVMHSSLSSVANKKLGQQVGVDAYVGKFHPEDLAGMVTSMLPA
ncbi:MULTISPECIES: chemotaxis protein [Limnobacter]|uniref:Chemotaxis protein CheW n=1 Tax=Limnobacter litoralis TaxID=481366 RepID=A0ABQ5YTD4_9BURK|nr:MULTISPECIES: chemotaxis protein [Limnobacter]GLR26707.1 chemotaxis protein CheW [Limnobacter litoralis]HEX5486878.1 chemotaxis protein [Limnobacter sp.]